MARRNPILSSTLDAWLQETNVVLSSFFGGNKMNDKERDAAIEAAYLALDGTEYMTTVLREFWDAAVAATKAEIADELQAKVRVIKGRGVGTALEALYSILDYITELRGESDRPAEKEEATK